jgi:hypothetical protein
VGGKVARYASSCAARGGGRWHRPCPATGYDDAGVATGIGPNDRACRGRARPGRWRANREFAWQMKIFRGKGVVEQEGRR